MVKYYILVKRKNSKDWVGAIPAKSGVTLTRLKKGISGQIKKGYTYRIVTESQLKKVLNRIKPKRKRTRKSRSSKKRSKTTKSKRRKSKSRRKRKSRTSKRSKRRKRR